MPSQFLPNNFVDTGVPPLPIPPTNNNETITEMIIFSDDPGSINVGYLTVQAGYRLDAFFVLHEDNDIPMGGTLNVERRMISGALINQLNTDSPIELAKLDAAGRTLFLTTSTGIDNAEGNVAVKLVSSPTAREYTTGELCKISVANLTCSNTAKLRVWGRCVRIS